MTGRKLSLEHRESIGSGLVQAYQAGRRSSEIQSAGLAGKAKSPEHVEKVRLALTGRKLAVEHCKRLSEAHRGKPLSAAHAAAAARARTGLKHSAAFGAAVSKRMRESNPMRGKFGPAHHNWVSDRAALAPRTRDRTTASLVWARAVKKRDGNRCAFCTIGECAGRLEAHHIRSFRLYPELRYDVANGISLCQAHHPRKRAEAEKLAPLFESMVTNKKG